MLLQSATTPSNHNSYQRTSVGTSDTRYSNIQKMPVAETRFSGGYGDLRNEMESYRSTSPPADERSAMMAMHPMQFQQGEFGSPGLALGLMSPNIPGYPTPTYYDSQSHEIQMGGGNGNVYPVAGLRPYNPQDYFQGPHELAVPSRNPSDANLRAVSTTESTRPFSFTDSESGFQADRKT